MSINKFVIIPILALILSNTASLVAGDSTKDNAIGMWGGKWDGSWPIVLTIEATEKPDTYKVRYQWVENWGNAELSTRDSIVQKTDDYFKTGRLVFRMTETNGLIYGDFKNPRRSNLVRLSSSYQPSINTIAEELKKCGWKRKVISAQDALKEITGEP